MINKTMKAGEWYDRSEKDPYHSPFRQRDKERRQQYLREHQERVASYGIEEGDLVAFIDHEPNKSVFGYRRGDRLKVGRLGLICRLLPQGHYVSIDKLHKVDPSLGVFIWKWDSRGSRVGDEVRLLTPEEQETQLQFADEMYEEFLRRKEKK